MEKSKMVPIISDVSVTQNYTRHTDVDTEKDIDDSIRDAMSQSEMAHAIWLDLIS